ncbi:MAG TPA: transposase [Bdellovibrionota bacterium]|jgi:REP element-mobilizing transposase RayT|nr:transposase [Bdellovibrionota bacterium]
MPRKKLIYTPDFPYHVCARANNKEWFYLPKPHVWKIFCLHAARVFAKFGTCVHAFVLMDNHYHLLVSTQENFSLGVVMQDFQKSVSHHINQIARRQNHVFGGPYRASLVTTDFHYAQVLKYIYRNPIEAGLCVSCHDYRYSTLVNDQVSVCSPLSGIALRVPTGDLLLPWLNEASGNERQSIQRGLRKTVYRPVGRL